MSIICLVSCITYHVLCIINHVLCIICGICGCIMCYRCWYSSYYILYHSFTLSVENVVSYILNKSMIPAYITCCFSNVFFWFPFSPIFSFTCFHSFSFQLSVVLFLFRVDILLSVVLPLFCVWFNVVVWLESIICNQFSYFCCSVFVVDLMKYIKMGCELLIIIHTWTCTASMTCHVHNHIIQTEGCYSCTCDILFELTRHHQQCTLLACLLAHIPNKYRDMFCG